MLPRDGTEIGLQPGDHLAVQFHDLTDSQMDLATRFVDHGSMNLLRLSEPLSLYDCFRAFTERLARSMCGRSGIATVLFTCYLSK